MMMLCLVVDDSQVIRKVATTVLASIGYEVIEAENGQDAIEKCQLQVPDAILVDRNMPGMGGHDFLALYLGSLDGLKPYTVFATNEYDADDISRAREMGADDYILKPIERTELITKFSQRRRAA